MYDMISELIGHEWITNYSGEQQYVYSICCVLILVVTISLVRWIDKIFFR